MSSNHTKNYSLCQWEKTDKVLMEDFNADNARIDVALNNLDESLSALSVSLDTKLGRSKIIDSYKSDGGILHSLTLPMSKINWNEWEYVCILIDYPGTIEEEIPLEFYLYINSEYKFIAPAITPGYLVTFIPRHNGASFVEGFVLSNRFIPFVLDSSFQTIRQVEFNVKKTSAVEPNVTFFGGK